MKSSNARRCGLMAAVVVVAVLATARPPRAQASVPSAGLAAQAAVSAMTGDYMLDFYYRVKGIDGKESIWVMQPYEASDFKKEKNRQYKQAVKDWQEFQVRWVKAVGRKPFPVAPPRKPSVKRLQRLAVDYDRRAKDTERFERRLERWAVCVIVAQNGEQSIDVLREDRVFSQQRALDTEFAEIYMELAEARKENPDADHGDPPKRPRVRVIRDDIDDHDLANKLADALRKKLAQKQAREEAKKAKEANGAN